MVHAVSGRGRDFGSGFAGLRTTCPTRQRKAGSHLETTRHRPFEFQDCDCMARLVIENLSKVFKGPKGEEILAVREASLIVEDKGLMVLVGPSGCGKSTLLRMIAGLEEVTRGTITVDGQAVNDVPPKDRDIAMVFQNFALYPHMTVYENMALGLRLRKVSNPEIEQRVKSAAQILDLTPCLHWLPKALSGGQRQRVAVGRAIVRQPRIFLFDEPLSNLDAPMRAQMRAELRRLHERLGATMVFVTHDQMEAMTMGDRIAVMKEGVMQQVAGPEELYQRPKNLFVAGFIGSPPMNLFPGRLVRRAGVLLFTTQTDSSGGSGPGVAVRLDEEHVPQLKGFEGRRVILGLRPENISPRAERSADFSRLTAPPDSAVVRTAVEVVERRGPEAYVYLSNGTSAIVARVTPGFEAERGQQVFVKLDMARAHFFDPATGLAIV